MMFLAAALLAVGAQAIHLRGVEDLDFCSGEECFDVLDRVHSTEMCAKKSPYHFMRCNALSKSVYSMSCAKGEGGCKLSFEDPEVALQASLPASTAEAQDLFAIMRSTGTDKVTSHHYSPLYQKYIGSLSQNGTAPFTFVEVGYATGNSARAWAKFLPSADVHEMEVSCDADFNRAVTAAGGASGPHRNLGYCKLHCGDATSQNFLEESLQGVEAPFIAVDDGGHGPEEMRLFFQHMWPKLQPGGMLFVEDLAESYAVAGGWVETTVKPLMMDLIAAKGTDSAKLPELSKDLVAMECREQICVFLKAK